MKRLVLSKASRSDKKSIEEFIKREKQENLGARYIISHSWPEIEDAIDGGLFFIIREEHHGLVATAYLADTGNDKDFELANCLVTQAWQRCGLQTLLICVRAVALAAAFDESQRLVTAVDPTNPSSSLRNLLKAGFQKANADRDWSCGPCPNKKDASEKGRDCCCDIYELPLAAHQAQCKTFLDITKFGPVIDIQRGNEPVRLVILWKVAYEDSYRKALEAYCENPI